MKELLYDGKESLLNEFDVLNSSAEDKDCQVECTLESTSNSQLVNSQLL